MSTWAEPLINFWNGHRQFAFNVHPKDLDTFQSDRHWSADPAAASKTPPLSSDRFLGETQERFITSLKPVPYCGDLRSAKAIILLLNPGFHPGDHLAEQDPSFLEAINATIDQDFTGSIARCPLFFLNPKYAASPAYAWWAKKFNSLASEVQRKAGLSKSEALRLIGNNVAILELVPYHSPSLRVGRFERSLASVEVARATVKRLLDEHSGTSPTVIVTRGASHWIDQQDRPEAEHKGWTIYSAGQARGASLGSTTSGGKAILQACLGAV